MENQILEIMLSKDDWDQDKSSTAKEITAHVFEFIEWLMTGCDGIFIQSHKTDALIFIGAVNEENTLNQVYSYWLNNIKSK
jgi:hypothetical protein